MKPLDEPAAAGGSARLFVALWPAAPLAAALAAWCEPHRCSAGMRPVPPGQVHLTLHFMGQVPRDRIPALCRALRAPFERHRLRFSRCERWHGGLLVAVPDDVPPALAGLHAALGDALRGLGLPTEARVFRPHVTLARHFGGTLPPALAKPLIWPVRRCALVESGAAAGGGYVVLCGARERLAGSGRDAAPRPG